MDLSVSPPSAAADPDWTPGMGPGSPGRAAGDGGATGGTPPTPPGPVTTGGSQPQGQSWLSLARGAWEAFLRAPIFWLGIAVLAGPTLYDLASRGWGTDQAAHAPIVFATAIWLFALSARDAAKAMRAPPAWAAVVALVPGLALYAAARITGLLEVRGLAAYLSLIAVLYAVGGKRVLGVLWFPILYSIFLIPIPDSFVDIATQPVKLAISKSVVGLLSGLGYPVATSGVSIYIGQFELLIAAACAGLNSLISLTAIGSFYVYLRHNASWRYTLLLVALILPIAVFANFLRVLILVLLTYYAGEAVAQGFLHEAAGLFMFVVSVLTIFAVDKLFTVVGRRFGWMKA